MAFEAKLDARQAFKIEAALERARASIAAAANLVERVGDGQIAESLRRDLESVREAKEALYDAGAGIREIPASLRPRGEAHVGGAPASA